MAMLPFCGYNMADYWSHWINMGKKDKDFLPKIFYVNWFRKDGEGNFVWPGFGENSRVLKWIFDRIEGKASAIETPIGNLPSPNSIDLEGLNLSERDLDNLLKVEIDGWLEEIPLIRDYYSSYGDKVPKELENELKVLTQKLRRAEKVA